MTDPNKKLPLIRKLEHAALFIELAYALLLLYSLVFNFKLFTYLIVGQFFIVLTYFLIGWVHAIYLKSHGKDIPQHYQKRETLADMFANLIPHYTIKKSLYHFLNILVIVLAGILFIISFFIIFRDLSSTSNTFDYFDSLALYFNIANQVFLFGLLVGLLMGYRRMVRNSSIGIMIFSIILAICWPYLWINYVLMLFTGFLGLILFIRNQI